MLRALPRCAGGARATSQVRVSAIAAALPSPKRSLLATAAHSSGTAAMSASALAEIAMPDMATTR